ncbi:MAG: hypothetical protein JW894_03490 [Bacteroidales bacterium]|nr:hypothetical protein [Bacteroidales bacterium]
MLIIKKNGESSYLATLTGRKEELGRNDCHIIRREITTMLRPHREIILDIKRIKTIDNGGFNILEDLMNLVNIKNCVLRFINVESSISSRIKKLSEKKAWKYDEMDVD